MTTRPDIPLEMIRSPNIAVFCGFRNGKDEEASERDFVYMLLKIFAHGGLDDASRRPGAGLNITSTPPLFDLFRLVREFGSESPIEAATKLMKECDFAIVILPYRVEGKFQTSVYALMEYAYALGTGLPVFLVVEDKVEISQLGFASERNRWKANLDRDSIKLDKHWPSLREEFIDFLQKNWLKKPLMAGLTEYKIDDFYREKLIPLVLDWHDIKIYNHSILPLSSSYRPAGDPQPPDQWEDFNGVQEMARTQPYRSLYFEVEEALLTKSKLRIERLRELLARDTFNDQLIEQIYNRIEAISNGEPFSLTRYASVIPYDAYSVFKDEEGFLQRRALARNFSILLQMCRLEARWKKKGELIKYRLFGFKTYYPYSMPTTIYAEREREVFGKAEKISGIWGFLRSSSPSQPGDDIDDFIIGQNWDCVEVWKRHIQVVNDTKTGDKPVPLFVEGEDTMFENFYTLIGPEMQNLLREEIQSRAERQESWWQEVLEVTRINL